MLVASTSSGQALNGTRPQANVDYIAYITHYTWLDRAGPPNFYDIHTLPVVVCTTAKISIYLSLSRRTIQLRSFDTPGRWLDDNFEPDAHLWNAEPVRPYLPVGDCSWRREVRPEFFLWGANTCEVGVNRGEGWSADSSGYKSN